MRLLVHLSCAVMVTPPARLFTMARVRTRSKGMLDVHGGWSPSCAGRRGKWPLDPELRKWNGEPLPPDAQGEQCGQTSEARQGLLIAQRPIMMKLGMCGFTIGAAAYYQQFSVLEVQQTFYDPPPIATLRRWRSEAPSTFEFTLKAWQVITHFGSSSTYRRLRSPFPDHARAEAGGFRLNDTVFAAWLTTLECAELLRATAILFQCPASFRPTPDNLGAMREFFRHIDHPPGIRFLWEPRGDWPDETIRELCRDLDLIHAVDPFIRPSLTPEVIYWRLHGNRSHYANYTDDELRQIYAWFPHDDRDGYVMFNNIPRVQDIQRFRTLAPNGRASWAG